MVGGKKSGKGGSSSSEEEGEIEVTTYQVQARPEGSAVGPRKNTVYISQLLVGGIQLLDLTTGKEEEVVPPAEDRSTAGITVYKNAIIAGGGGPRFEVTPSLHVFDIDTGDLIVTCFPPDGYLLVNDVIVKDGYVYATDTFFPAVLRFHAEALLAGKCVMDTIPLEPAEKFTADVENDILASNGIIAYKKGFLICTFGFGSVHYLDGDTYETTELITGLTFPDGLTIMNDKLYVIASPGVFVFKLKGGKAPTSAELIEEIIEEEFDALATGVFVSPKELVVMDLTLSQEFFVADTDPTATYKVHRIDL